MQAILSSETFIVLDGCFRSRVVFDQDKCPVRKGESSLPHWSGADETLYCLTQALPGIVSNVLQMGVCRICDGEVTTFLGLAVINGHKTWRREGSQQ